MAVVVSSSCEEDLERGEEPVYAPKRDITDQEGDDNEDARSYVSGLSAATTTAPVCRICLEGEFLPPPSSSSSSAAAAGGGVGNGTGAAAAADSSSLPFPSRLVSPCNCSGSVGRMHVPCLERWLSTTGLSTCELCGYQFELVRQPRPISDLLRNKFFVSNVVYFLVMSLVAGVSIWLCLVDTGLYLEHGHYWVVVEWFCIAFVILLFYTVWCKSAFRGQYQIWMEWKGKNQAVKIRGLSDLAENADDASSAQGCPTKCV